MDNKIAAALLASMLERVDRERTIGAVSSLERKALDLALQALQGDAPTLESIPEAPAAPPPPPVAAPMAEERRQPEPTPMAAPVEAPPDIELALDSLRQQTPTDPEVMLCLDFGTAMSKAFAMAHPDHYMELELGPVVGSQGYALPSSVFISEDGKAYFGQEAIDLSLELLDSGRKRLDSIKEWLSLRRGGGNLTSVLEPDFNPTPVRLTEGDLIRIYLAYLTDVACTALSKHEYKGKLIERYVRRRFARPCWPDQAQATWADALMRSMLCDAQVLADTFSGRWPGGVSLQELKTALEKLNALTDRPRYLIEAGVPEPVAVAAGAFEDMENLRDAFMVVDVGAGTTDFGLFVVTRRQDEESVRVFQVPASIQGLMQAGNKVDTLLRLFIARKESIDMADNAGRMNMADLGRRIRTLKEALFIAGEVDYTLADGTPGRVSLHDFLADEQVQRFEALVEEGFRKSLEALDDSWLRWLSQPGNRLRVVLTGGSSQLPMMRALARGTVVIKEAYRVEREPADARPLWLEGESEELNAVYPQLAVAIGGAAEEMPDTLTAPPVFGGGGSRSEYVAGRMQISGG